MANQEASPKAEVPKNRPSLEAAICGGPVFAGKDEAAAPPYRRREFFSPAPAAGIEFLFMPMLC